MTEMWLVRHGQTDWNLAKIVQGHSDIPLNETGITQARELAAKLSETHFDALYASDLLRAQQTAQILAETLHLDVILDSRLREIRQGDWEGHAILEIIEKYPDDFIGKNDNPNKPSAPGAESVAEVVTRMVAAANELHARHNGQRLLLVTHGFAIASLYCVANGIPIREVAAYIPDNGSPVVLTLDKPLETPDFSNN